jgi:hypothetical protein
MGRELSEEVTYGHGASRDPARHRNPAQGSAGSASSLALRVGQAEWDAEIERDISPGGDGIALLEEIKADTHAGKSRPFEQGRPQRR